MHIKENGDLYLKHPVGREEEREFLLLWDEDKRCWKINNGYVTAIFYQSNTERDKLDAKLHWLHPSADKWFWCFFREAICIYVEAEYLHEGWRLSFVSRKYKERDIRSFV